MTEKHLNLRLISGLVSTFFTIALILCGCVNNPVDTSTDPDNMIDSFAVNAEREEESRLQEALKDLCPYDREEFN